MPRIQPADVEATVLVKIGSGSTLPGYYMYHGGTNPEGKTTLMESQAIGYWNDLDDIGSNWALDRRFEPAMSADRRGELLHGWHRAVERSRAWIEPD